MIVQTYSPQHYAIQAARLHDYAAFSERELAFRRAHAYPPFRRLARLIFSDADESRLHLPLGQGGRDLVRLLGALRDYRGAIALEGFSIEAGTDLVRWNKGRFEELWRESTAVSGAVALSPPR